MNKTKFKNIRLTDLDFEYIRKKKNPSQYLRDLIKNSREAEEEAESTLNAPLSQDRQPPKDL